VNSRESGGFGPHVDHHINIIGGSNIGHLALDLMQKDHLATNGNQLPPRVGASSRSAAQESA